MYLGSYLQAKIFLINSILGCLRFWPKALTNIHYGGEAASTSKEGAAKK